MNQGYKRIISRYNLGGESSLYSRLTLQLSADQSTCRLPLGNGQASFTLRASNEGLLRPRIARAQKIIRLHPLLPYCIFKGSLIDPRLRASNEHIPIVRVPREGGRPGYP